MTSTHAPASPRRTAAGAVVPMACAVHGLFVILIVGERVVFGRDERAVNTEPRYVISIFAVLIIEVSVKAFESVRLRRIAHHSTQDSSTPMIRWHSRRSAARREERR
jgi:hypothetical protein